MKKISAFLVLAAITLQVMAQNTRIPDLTLDMDFSPVDGSPSNLAIGGEAEYNRIETPPPYYPNVPILTNYLEIWVSLPSIPENARVLEKTSNGNLIPVMEITNLSGNSDYGYNYFQPYILTEKQIHSLVEGNWYVDVDFGGSNYISNLAPQYQIANGPTAVIDFQTPIYQQAYDEGLTIFIAKNNRNARIVMDASQSSDPFYLPKKYSWSIFDGDYNGAHTVLFTNTDAVVTYAFSPGLHGLYLQVDDAITSGRPAFTSVEVITPGQAVDGVIQEAQYLPLPENQTQMLVGILSRAQALFDRGDMAQGCFELKYFIRKTESLQIPGYVDDFMIQCARRIIAVLGFPIESKVIMFE
jgi:hypothetical protein